MIIVLEGPDGSGKTTLAREIECALGLHYRHEGPEPTLGPEELMARYLKSAEDGVVWDRFATSELVYAAAMRRPDRIGRAGEALAMAAMRRAGTLVRVLCLPPFVACMDAFRRGEDYVDRDQLARAWSGYSALAVDRRRWEARWDRTADPEMRIVNRLRLWPGRSVR